MNEQELNEIETKFANEEVIQKLLSEYKKLKCHKPCKSGGCKHKVNTSDTEVCHHPIKE